MVRHRKRFFFALVITLLVFLSGLLLGSIISEFHTSKIDNIRNKIDLENQGLELEYILMLETPCNFEGAESLSTMLTAFGSELAELEDIGSKDSNLKNEYYVLEIKHWLFIKRLNEECGRDYPWILYFYSNEYCFECPRQGDVLNKIKEENPDVMIYSFDYNSGFSVINSIKKLYNIDSTPTLIINEEKYEGLIEEEELKNILEIKS